MKDNHFEPTFSRSAIIASMLIAGGLASAVLILQWAAGALAAWPAVVTTTLIGISILIMLRTASANNQWRPRETRYSLVLFMISVCSAYVVGFNLADMAVIHGDDVSGWLRSLIGASVLLGLCLSTMFSFIWVDVVFDATEPQV